MNSKQDIHTDDKLTKDLSKEDNTMLANTALKIDNNYFNEFLKLNKAKIDVITPKNPSISKEDEWYSETCWDTDYKENNDK